MTADHLARFPKPLAVFASQDSEARRIVAMCLAADMAVPDEVAVWGVNNDELDVEFCGVPISSIALPGHQIGFRAAQWLDQLMQGVPSCDASPLRCTPTELVSRQSTDAMAISDPDVALAVRYIRSRLGRELTVQHLLAVVPLSRRSLELRFRRALGRSPAVEIRRLRLARAQRLLGEAELSVPQFAKASGFASPAQFAKTFRAAVDMTPRDLRRWLRQGRRQALGTLQPPAATHGERSGRAPKLPPAQRRQGSS